MISTPIVPIEPSPRPRSALAPLSRLPEEWVELLQSWGYPPFRARQIFRWLHSQHEMRPSQMTNLPQSLREALERELDFTPVVVESAHRSLDGTRKLLFQLADGKRVEGVLIPMPRLDATPESQERVTLCISTQVGCAMGCVFCASGLAGLDRGLGAHEIVAQVLLARAHLAPGEYIRNLVFMGMGEPLHHYAETARAIRLLSHPEGLHLGLRRMTVSTVGLVPGIEKLGRDFEGKVGLAVSLHAPNTLLRSELIPMNRRYPLSDLLAALRAYPLPPRRRITIEYTLIAGKNDSLECADELVQTLRGLAVKVNLIPMNAVAGSPLGAPSAEQVDAFQARLRQRNLSCSVRGRKGDDVQAACGQLALRTGALSVKPTS